MEGDDTLSHMAPAPTSGVSDSKMIVKMKASGEQGKNPYAPPMSTLKTGPIENLPCGNCQNFVTTLPVESKFPIPALPFIGCFGLLWCQNKFDCWYKRLEHLCPNCGVILLVCNKPIPPKKKPKFKVLQMKWHRVLPAAIHDKKRWETFDENWSLINPGDDV